VARPRGIRGSERQVARTRMGWADLDKCQIIEG
jgi:hypothetical protein